MSLLYKIAITKIKGVGPVLTKALISQFGSPEHVFKAGKKQLMRVPGVGERTADVIQAADVLRQAEKELEYLRRNNIDVLFYTDERYPSKLRSCFDAPMLLYYKGTADLNLQRIVSVVGTRKATDYGRQLCRQLIETLAEHNVMVVSGLAYGIDVAVHKECLHRHVPTIGVMGHGLDRLYPRTHTDIAHKMVQNGGLLTEFPLHTGPDKENFPKRNRIIAGMADVTVVVEASLKGGALITAELANAYNRDVYAFPGRTNDQFSEGCNFIIKTNRAALISHPKDLIYYLGWDDRPKTTAAEKQISMPLGLNLEEQQILNELNKGPVSVDGLALRTGLPQSKMAIALLELEMQGLLVALPGKVYRLATAANY